MSRKDLRRVLRVPLPPGARQALRSRIHRRSLADAARRTVQQGLASGARIVPWQGTPASVLNVQLPAKDLRQISGLAAALGAREEEIVAGILFLTLMLSES